MRRLRCVQHLGCNTQLKAAEQKRGPGKRRQGGEVGRCEQACKHVSAMPGSGNRHAGAVWEHKCKGSSSCPASKRRKPAAAHSRVKGVALQIHLLEELACGAGGDGLAWAAGLRSGKQTKLQKMTETAAGALPGCSPGNCLLVGALPTQGALARALHHRQPHHCGVGRRQRPNLVARGSVLRESKRVSKPYGRQEDVCHRWRGGQERRLGCWVGGSWLTLRCRLNLQHSTACTSRSSQPSSDVSPHQAFKPRIQASSLARLTVAAGHAAPPVCALVCARPLPRPHERCVVLDGVPRLGVVPSECDLRGRRGCGASCALKLVAGGRGSAACRAPCHPGAVQLASRPRQHRMQEALPACRSTLPAHKVDALQFRRGERGRSA